MRIPLLPVMRSLLLLSTLLVAARAYTYPDCKNGPLAKLPICDPTASTDARAQSYLAQLNVTEKMSRLDSGSPAIPRLGIPELDWVNDALHGLTCCHNFQYLDGNVPFNSSTSFPSPINYGATFDDDLAFSLGQWTGIEARAFTNANRGGVDLWSPNINPFRDPRWGRGQEVPGEVRSVADRAVDEEQPSPCQLLYSSLLRLPLCTSLCGSGSVQGRPLRVQLRHGHAAWGGLALLPGRGGLQALRSV